MTTSEQPVRLDAVTKRYGRRAAAATALDAVTLGFERGSFTAVMGPSGSGKSTLLQCAAGLDRPTRARCARRAPTSAGLREDALTRLRRERIGFVFQSFNLLPALTAAENVALPLRLAGRRPDRGPRRRRARPRSAWPSGPRHRPAQLSGGQQQRVAIARALVTRPGGAVRRRADRRAGHRDRAARCSACCGQPSTARPRPWSWSPTTRWPPRTRTGWCSSPTAGWPAS